MVAKLRYDQVFKAFGQRVVLNGVTLDVARGEVITLIGASGSGKSTLLRCTNLLEPIDDGAIWLEGEDITVPGLKPDPIRRRIGMVFQSFNLFPHMNVLDNVTLAPRKVLGQNAAEARDAAMTTLSRIGLADKAGDYPDRLSGGQQQRVAIVRALMMQPEVMLLDEITSALDPELVGEVLEMVRELRAQGMTMLLATHEMSFAREISDRVCFLKAGVLAEIGPPEQIFSSPTNADTQEFLARVIASGRM
jgi:polar amino acid transport system ATP-binding protein